MINLQFKELKLHNFGPYLDAQIMLENKGFCIVTGQNNYIKDNALSNGSGKSFIWSGICYALTGETIGGFHTNLMNINATDNKMSVVLDFYAGVDHFVIERGQTPAKYLLISKNDINYSGKTFTESTSKLEELLPDLTRELLATSIILGQGMPLKFSSFSPSGRKELLEKLTKSDYMIDDIKARVAARNDSLVKLQRSYEDSNLINKTQLSTLKIDFEKMQTELNSAIKPDFDKAIEESKNLIKSIEKDSKKLIEARDLKDKEIENKNNELLNITKQKSDTLLALSEEYQTACAPIKQEKLTIETTIHNLNTEIIRVKNIKDICPTCGQKLQGVHKPDTTEQENQIKTLTESLVPLNEKLTKIEQKNIEYKEEINKQTVEKETELSTALVNLRKDRNNIINELNDVSQNLNTEKEHYNKLCYDKEHWDKYYLELQNKISSNKSAQAVLEKAISTIESAQTDVLARLAIIKKIDTLIKRDFRGYLLSNIISYLDKKAKDFSNIVFGTRELDLFIDGNALNITYCGKIMDNLSGGEKTRVDLIIQLALRAMLKKYLNFNSNILVLDEITDFLDKKSCKAVMSLLETELNTVESVFIISHHASELELATDSELKIVKNADGNSEIY